MFVMQGIGDMGTEKPVALGYPGVCSHYQFIWNIIANLFGV